jgi:hypothetical protein
MITMLRHNADQEPEAPASGICFLKHDRVRHPDFGRGYVADVRGETCEVFFVEDGKVRVLRQSKLERCT